MKRRVAAIPLLIIVATGLLSPSVLADVGDLAQLDGAAGCILEAPSTDCADGRALDDARAMAVSPDGRHVYVASTMSDAIAVFDRGPSDGALIQKSDTAGCISLGGVGGCGSAVALDGPMELTISRDGKTLYVLTRAHPTDGGVNGIVVFNRAGDGTLVQKSGSAGCLNGDGASGCTAISGPFGRTLTIAVATDDSTVYVGGSGGIIVLDRLKDGAATGDLSQKALPAGCVSSDGPSTGCTPARAMADPNNIAVTQDGANVYATSSNSDSLTIFDRSSDGTLVEKSGLAGCFSRDGSSGECRVEPRLHLASAVVVSPGGSTVYATSQGSFVFFERITSGVASGELVVNDALLPATGRTTPRIRLVLSGDGTTLYSGGNSIGIYDRDPETGALSQDTGAAGCIQRDGLSGCSAARHVRGIALAVSADGRSLYADAGADDGVA